MSWAVKLMELLLCGASSLCWLLELPSLEMGVGISKKLCDAPVACVTCVAVDALVRAVSAVAFSRFLSLVELWGNRSWRSSSSLVSPANADILFGRLLLLALLLLLLLLLLLFLLFLLWVVPRLLFMASHRVALANNSSSRSCRLLCKRLGQKAALT